MDIGFEWMYVLHILQHIQHGVYTPTTTIRVTLFIDYPPIYIQWAGTHSFPLRVCILMCVDFEIDFGGWDQCFSQALLFLCHFVSIFARVMFI